MHQGCDALTSSHVAVRRMASYCFIIGASEFARNCTGIYPRGVQIRWLHRILNTAPNITEGRVDFEGLAPSVNGLASRLTRTLIRA